jgi:hypothetical protein
MDFTIHAMQEAVMVTLMAAASRAPGFDNGGMRTKQVRFS